MYIVKKYLLKKVLVNVVKVQCYRTFTSTETHGGGRGVKTRGGGVGGCQDPGGRVGYGVKTRGEGGVWCQDPRGREVVVSADGVGLGGGLTKILAGEVVS